MRVLDTATILAAMAHVSSRERRLVALPAVPSPIAAPAVRGTAVRLPAGRARACHRPTPRPPGDPDDHDGTGAPRSRLVVVPQGVIPVMVASSRLWWPMRRFAVAS